MLGEWRAAPLGQEWRAGPRCHLGVLQSCSQPLRKPIYLQVHLRSLRGKEAGSEGHGLPQPRPGPRHSRQGGGGQAHPRPTVESAWVWSQQVRLAACSQEWPQWGRIRLPETPKQKGTHPAQHTPRRGLQHCRRRCWRGALGVWDTAGLAVPLPPQFHSCPAVTGGLSSLNCLSPGKSS